MGWSNDIEIETKGSVRFDDIDKLVNELDYPYVVNGSLLFRDNGEGGLEVLDLSEMEDGDEPVYGDSGGTLINRGSIDARGLKAFADHLVSGRIVIKQQYEDTADPPTLFVVEPGKVTEISIANLMKSLAENGVDGAELIDKPKQGAGRTSAPPFNLER